MENKELYYEVNVRTADDIRRAAEFVATNNKKYYRCVSNSGKYYGWNGIRHVEAAAGQEWFENDKYVEPIAAAPTEAENAPVESVNDLDGESIEATENSDPTPEIADIADEQRENVPDENSRDLEARIAELEKELAERDVLLDQKNEFSRLQAKRIAEDEQKLTELKNAVNVIIDFIKGV